MVDIIDDGGHGLVLKQHQDRIALNGQCSVLSEMPRQVGNTKSDEQTGRDLSIVFSVTKENILAHLFKRKAFKANKILREFIPKNSVEFLNKFADDTKLCRAVGDDQEADILREDLRRMFRWSQDWQMLFNLEKCAV